jgi:Mlc titration factor MtfA (ptsG expression regulator)
MPNFAHLDPAQQERLCAMTQGFITEKHWEGCGGIELTDEIRVTIAAEACLLLLGLEHLRYRNVETILVYPSTFVPKRVEAPIFAPPTIVKDAVPLLGEAHRRGPLILTWDSVRRPHPGHNVVYHEFAHKLDMLDGYADGVPPLESGRQYRRWVEVCKREYEQLRVQIEQGLETFLDPYAGTDPSEFFAVSSEYFFSCPSAMMEACSDLYQVLADFYRQDPAARERRFLASRPSRRMLC